MRVDDDRGRSVGKDGPGKFRNGHHARFDVDVAINQPRAEEIAFHIDDLFCLVITEADNHALPDGDIRPFDLARKDIDHPSVLDQKIDFPLA